MSHFATIKVQYKRKSILLKTLRQMGFQPIDSKEPVKLVNEWNADRQSFYGNIVIPKDQLTSYYPYSSKRADIGFLWNAEDKAYELICDRYGMTANFLQNLGLAYSKEVAETVVRQDINLQGYAVRQDGNKIVIEKALQTV